MRRAARTGLGAAMAGLLAAALLAAAAEALADGRLKLPRFVSLNADRVNLRAGPGLRHPIEWVFVRKSLPVKIVKEFDHWRLIRDWEGVEGWIHVSLLSGKRTAMVIEGMAPLHRSPDPESPVIAQAETLVVGRLRSCDAQWCSVIIGGHSGWMRRRHLWGAGPAE